MTWNAKHLPHYLPLFCSMAIVIYTIAVIKTILSLNEVHLFPSEN